MSNQLNGNAALFFVDRHAEGANADKAAFIESDGEKRSLTHAELGEQSGRMAQFYEKHQIPSEARAAMLVADQVEFPIIFWGSLCLRVHKTLSSSR